MKKLGMVLASSVVLAACGGDKDVELKTDDQKASYAIGYTQSEQLGQVSQIDQQALLAGIRDGFDESTDSQLGDANVEELITGFQQRMMESKQQEMNEQASSNQKASESFLAENAEKDGVTVTDSGLQYKVMEEGEQGASSPTLDDKVEVHYHGTLIDGTVFDSSVENGEPVTFGLNRIIPGWQEALPMMKEGDKWKIFLPPKLAYGEQAPADIGPNQALIFEIELLDVKGSGDSDEQAGE